jgi:hypothetical protein
MNRASILVGSSVMCAAVFGAIYYPVANRLVRGVASPYPKAPLSARFGAGLVDAFAILTGLAFYIQSGSIAYPFASAAYLLFRDSTAEFWEILF